MLKSKFRRLLSLSNISFANQIWEATVVISFKIILKQKDKPDYIIKLLKLKHLQMKKNVFR